MSTDSIADLLTRIRNAQGAGHKTALVVSSKLNRSILEVMREQGYIGAFEEVDAQGGGKHFDVTLCYLGNGTPVIRKAERASKPGRRVYSNVADLPRVESGLGVALISTSQGIMTDQQARKQQIGGEVLAYIS